MTFGNGSFKAGKGKVGGKPLNVSTHDLSSPLMRENVGNVVCALGPLK